MPQLPTAYALCSNPPGTGFKRPGQEKKKVFPTANKNSSRPSERPPPDHLGSVIKLLPVSFKHDVFDRAYLNKLLFDDIQKHRNYDTPEALPDKLP